MENGQQSNFSNYFLKITVIMLFGALLEWPYSYFILLRWIVAIGAVIVAIDAFNKNVDWAKVSFIIIGILFNPITPIYLSREIWIFLDIIVGIMFISYSKILK